MNNSTNEVSLSPPAGMSSGSEAKGAKGDSQAKSDGSDGTSSYSIDFWDTAGQEVFTALHPSYYYATSCCILCFDVTRKITYTHLTDWYNEYNSYCSRSSATSSSGNALPPCILVANKIDVDYHVSFCWHAQCVQHSAVCGVADSYCDVLWDCGVGYKKGV